MLFEKEDLVSRYLNIFKASIYFPKYMDIILFDLRSHNFITYYMIINDIFKVLGSLQNAFPILPFQQHCEVDTGKKK